MDAPETRELRYFVAVAEELHFGRAAQRLGMAQPPLSRAIQQLERRIGVALLERSSRAVRLTPAGEVFLAESRKALDATFAAVRRTQRAGRDEPRLLVAMKPNGDGGLLEPIRRRCRSDPDAAELEVVVCGIGEQASLLRTGRVDVAFLHAPHDDLSGFDTELLLTLDQVAMLPAGHRLAGSAALALSDLADEPTPRWPGQYWAETNGQNGGQHMHDIAQVMQLVALGQLVAVLPASVRGYARPDVVCVPMLDAPRISVLLAWPERTTSRAVAAFARAAAEVAEVVPPAATQEVLAGGLERR